MSASPQRVGQSSSDSGGATGTLSCLQCRNRKLKCDKRLPECNRCIKQEEKCQYPGSRQRVLGRRRTVQELEDRIEQLEGQLRAANLDSRASQQESADISLATLPQATDAAGVSLFDSEMLQGGIWDQSQQDMDPSLYGLQPPSANQLINMGLFEQLPSFELIDQLTALYFQRIHPGAPMLHQASYSASLRLPPHMRPPMCLQYIVMASAAATVETFRHLAEPFYHRARIYAEADELKDPGDTFTTLAHVQSWCLISAYECHVYAIFTRASTSHCRAVRIAQMLGLHQLDLPGNQASRSGLPPPRNNIEAEERRRTWWMVFLADRYLCATTGWPSVIEERHIQNNLPSSEEAFDAGVEGTRVAFQDAMQLLKAGHGNRISSFGFRILSANELLHALYHRLRETEDGDEMMRESAEFWNRQVEIDSNLGLLIASLPESLRLSRGMRSLDAILIHASVGMAIIQLHRYALSVMQPYWTLPEIASQSRARLLPAAQGLCNIFRAAGDNVGTAVRNPLLGFSAYMAASVFLDDFQAAESLHDQRRASEQNLNFLAQLLAYYSRTSPLVKTTASQLAADMRRSGYDSSAMEVVLNQSSNPRVNRTILKPGSKDKPMVFCPALTSVPEHGQ